MHPIKQILTFLMLLLFAVNSGAQTFKVKSLDGSVQRIHLGHELGDQKLVISYLNDKITLNDFMDISKISILKGCFLEVQYSIRIGSDQNYERLILLCVNNNKLYQVLHVESLDTYNMDQEYGDYELKVKLTGDDKRTYKLKATIHDEIKSKSDPKTNHNNNKRVTLSFDSNQNIFYSDLENISHYFMVYNFGIRKYTKRYIMGRYLTVKMDKANYYYIKGEWYEKGNNDYLISYAQ